MVRQIGISVGDIKKYQCATTDDISDYPTADMCGAGSEMIIIDDTVHEITDILYFDGTHWNTI